MATANLFSQTQAGLNQAAGDINDIYSQISDLGLQRTELANDAAKDQATVTLTEQLAVAKQQKQALDYATKLGTNPEADSEQLSQLISDKNALFLQARSSLKDIQRKRDTSLFLQPGQWLVDNLTLDKSVNSYNDAAAEYNLVGKRIDDMVSSTDDIVKMTKGIAVSVTDASAQAAANVASARLKDAAFSANIESLKSNAQGIQLVTQLKQEQLNNSVRQQQLGMEQERLALSRQSAALEQKRMTMALEDKAEGKQEQERTVQAVNLYRKANGMPELSWTDMKLLYKDPQQKQLMDQQIIGGLTIAQTGSRYLADSPVNAMTISALNGAQLAEGPKQLVNTANTQLAKIRADLAKPNAPKVTSQEIQNRVNENMKTLARNEQSEIKQGNSMYTLPSLTTFMTDPEIAKTATARLILPALKDAGAKEFNPTQVIPLILEKAKSGEIPVNQAVEEITFLGRKAMAYNNAYYSYESTMGLPNLKDFNVKLETTSQLRRTANDISRGINDIFAPLPVIGGLNPAGNALASEGKLIGAVFGGVSTEITDITNPAKVQDYANRYLANKISINLKQQAAANSNKTKAKN